MTTRIDLKTWRKVVIAFALSLTLIIPIACDIDNDQPDKPVVPEHAVPTSPSNQ